MLTTFSSSGLRHVLLVGARALVVGAVAEDEEERDEQQVCGHQPEVVRVVQGRELATVLPVRRRRACLVERGFPREAFGHAFRNDDEDDGLKGVGAFARCVMRKHD